jgi:uncharacterized protein (TIGR03067 family)
VYSFIFALFLLLSVTSARVEALMAADDAEDKDRKALQGTWQITSFVGGGKATPADELKDMKLIFKDDSITLSVSGREEMRGTFKLNATKKPKTVDTKPANGDGLSLGIYELDGDTLKWSFNKAGSKLPKDFTEKDVGLMILKREK